MTSFFRRLRKRFSRPSYALNGLDLKMLRWIDFRNGFFIEAGANDGLTQSNTLFFERHRDWNGLLIEPVPRLAELCRSNRPSCIVENCALIAADDPRAAVPMQYCNLMSIVKGAMKSDAADRAHIEAGCQVQGIESHELTVPARTLDHVLASHGIDHVDFFSLDVEGYELQVLKGLTQIQPLFLLIEVRDRAAVEAHLAPHYAVEAVLSDHDVLFRRRA